MIEKLLNYVKGWVYICVIGASPERFLNICNHNAIEMLDVSSENDKLHIRINASDFKKLKEIAKKTKVHIRIEERYGLPFFLFKNRKRKMFALGIISALILVYTMSLHIWQITFVGNYSYTEDELTDFLAREGISNGIKKEKCNIEDIERALRNKYNDIKWTSIEIVGTRMIVHIKENFNEISEKNTGDNYSIVANKDAEIISIVTGKGTPLVKAGDMVKIGDVLIGGYYDIKSDYEELIETRMVAAEGTILAKTQYNINNTIDRKYEKKVYTGESSKKYELKAFDKILDIDYFFDEYDKYDEISESTQLVVGDNFYLPFYFVEKTGREYKLKEFYYDDDEGYRVGQQIVDDFLQNLIEKGIQITQNNVKIEVNENSIVIFGEVICYEYIGEKRIE